MKSLVIVAALVAGAPAFSQDSLTTPSLTITGPSCAFARISADDVVTVNWSCVQIHAAEYKARRSTSTTAAFALVLDALRDGTAIAE